MLYGYRVKKREGYNYIVIQATKILLGDELKLEMNRIERMRKRRNEVEYGVSEILKTELIQAAKDAKAIIKKLEDLISENDPQDKLI